jgi:hypothetical protein
MADTVMFVGWNRPVVGREGKAVELFNSFLAFMGKQQQQNVIESFEPVFLQGHGGDLNGFVLIRGDKLKLATLRTTNEWLDLYTQISINTENFGVIDGWVGEGVKAQLNRYMNAIR